MLKPALRTNSLRALLAVFALLTLSCVVTSDSPVSHLEESEAIPAYLDGTWDVIEVAGLDAHDDDSHITFERVPGGPLRYTLTEGGSTLHRSASLVAVGGLTILSLAPDDEDGDWSFASIVHDEANQELTIAFLGHAEVVRDIRLGHVPGEVYEFDDRELAHLTGSSAELRSYLAAHPEVFSDRIAVLRKRNS